MPEHGALPERLIGLAIGVREIVGPGVLESVYQECLCLELTDAGTPFQGEVILPVSYNGRSIPLGRRAGILVAYGVMLKIR